MTKMGNYSKWRCFAVKKYTYLRAVVAKMFFCMSHSHIAGCRALYFPVSCLALLSKKANMKKKKTERDVVTDWTAWPHCVKVPKTLWERLASCADTDTKLLRWRGVYLTPGLWGAGEGRGSTPGQQFNENEQIHNRAQRIPKSKSRRGPEISMAFHNSADWTENI